MIRTIAEFKTSIPDDTEEDDDDIILFGGRAVALVIGEMLTEQGFAVEPLDYAEHKGWEFSARVVRDKAKTKLWFLITLGDDVILQSEDTTLSIFGKVDHTVFPKTLVRLNEQMAEDPQFSDVVWYPRSGYDEHRGGAASPLG